MVLPSKRFNWRGKGTVLALSVAKPAPHDKSALFTGRDNFDFKPGRNEQERICSGQSYVIFCDQNIYLPFYAVNIVPADCHYGEVIAANEEDPCDAWLAAPSIEAFADYLMSHYSEPLLMVDAY